MLVVLLIVARLMIIRRNYRLKTAETDLLLARLDAMDAENRRLRAEMKSMPDAGVVGSLRDDLNENISRRIEVIDRICYLWMTSPGDRLKSDTTIRRRIDRLIEDDLLSVVAGLVDRKHNHIAARIKADGRLNMTDDQFALLLLMLAGFSREGMMAILGKERNAVTVAIHRLKKLISTWPQDISEEITAIITAA